MVIKDSSEVTLTSLQAQVEALIALGPRVASCPGTYEEATNLLTALKQMQYLTPLVRARRAKLWGQEHEADMERRRVERRDEREAIRVAELNATRIGEGGVG